MLYPCGGMQAGGAAAGFYFRMQKGKAEGMDIGRANINGQII